MRSSAVQSSLLALLDLAMGCDPSGPLPQWAWRGGTPSSDSEAGMDLSRVVQVTTWLADMTGDARCNEIHREYSAAEPLPTRVTVAGRELARKNRVEMMKVEVR